MVFKLPDLSYSYDSLEPFFDAKTMEIHYSKHHQAYINNANSALKNLPKFSNLTIENLIKQLDFLPQEKKDILRNNGGGHFNHSLFWKSLKLGTELKGSLKKAIENTFIDYNNFKKEFEQVSMSRFGSGWTWLIIHNNNLKIVSTPNQDNPLMENKLSHTYGFPIFGLDLWEHSYYLKYQNRRLDYVKAFWNIINWDEASRRFDESFYLN
ncbi:manganese superoxide dismutase [Candidatus Blochmanniella vafra str. BVAF]|uniref:Superoxide dismutase n=1 Tax=Blochmanniella vafra (strain BVAF) TaxID=859654 RepID=E8Q5W6_BLOVB|nr:Fe-Mn family superoxide dismutase [Candidatus Blochmannia vafer]ADV33435.1 manganese superoxide dismutase [Candidatus Blochmannia vafer str. BVAF]